MKENDNMRVYGTNQNTGEYKLIFRCITIHDWNMRGKKNAADHNYSEFKFFTIASLQNHFSESQIITL